jgi:C4-dicarboxylate transporter/malic acid transport protein
MNIVEAPQPTFARVAPAPTANAAVPHRLARLGLLGELEHPGQLFANLTPNWYASIMGTGIVAVAAASLPEQFRGLHAFAIGVWATSALLLIALTAATTVHWVRHPDTARSHANHPVMVHFYGAPPMALMTVGAGTILLGRDVLGLPAAVDLDWALWTAGTVFGLATAAVVPYLVLTRHTVTAGSAFGGWLMPVVPPMVSASTGALLIPHAAAGPARLTMLMACYAMFGLSLLASLVVITFIWHRVAAHQAEEARMVPTLWIVLGPLGQSITAANLLGGVAHEALPARCATVLRVFGVVYGLPVFGFAVLWATVAAAITIRTVREGMPFSLTWWSFTFPVGTCVTGTSALARHTGSDLFRVAALLFYAGLVVAWVVVATRTAHGSARGRLFLPVPNREAPPAVR